MDEHLMTQKKLTEKIAGFSFADRLTEYEKWGVEEAKVLHAWPSEYDLERANRYKEISRNALLEVNSELREHALEVHQMLAYTLFLADEYRQPTEQIRAAYNTARDRIINQDGDDQ